MSMYSSRVAKRLFVASAIAVLLLLMLAASAYAAGPATFSSPSPATGGVVTTRNSAVSVRVSDPAGVQSGTITVPGATMSYTAIDYPIGHWEDPDGCGAVWVVDDYTQAILTAYPISPYLPLGLNTATANVRNGSGIDSDYSWSYTVDLAPTITTVSPPTNAVVSATHTHDLGDDRRRGQLVLGDDDRRRIYGRSHLQRRHEDVHLHPVDAVPGLLPRTS